ncbi:hypothetical protein KBC99_02060 [Candidatus Saccharibacteria bacterium]|nr:hypothetical protein [Candidatus Saccharibacteria bacterium]
MASRSKKTSQKDSRSSLGSRAVLRDIPAGQFIDCPHCKQRVKFQAKSKARQVICNVYVRGKWNRVDHFHEACYKAAGQPHGVPDRTPTSRQRQTQAAQERGRELVAAS